MPNLINNFVNILRTALLLQKLDTLSECHGHVRSKPRSQEYIKGKPCSILEATFLNWVDWDFDRVFVLMILRLNLHICHVQSKTRSLVVLIVSCWNVDRMLWLMISRPTSNVADICQRLGHKVIFENNILNCSNLGRIVSNPRLLGQTCENINGQSSISFPVR